jgi:N utilization substance protein B
MINGSSNLKTVDLKMVRKFSVQFLYQQDVNQQLFMQDSTLRNFLVQNQVPEYQRAFFLSFLETLFQMRENLDMLIEKHSKNWKISRIAKVDLAVMRVAVLELLERPDTDVPVILSEAAALAQEFGSSHSSSFVNGILDSIAKEVRKK